MSIIVRVLSKILANQWNRQITSQKRTKLEDSDCMILRFKVTIIIRVCYWNRDQIDSCLCDQLIFNKAWKISRETKRLLNTQCCKNWICMWGRKGLLPIHPIIHKNSIEIDSRLNWKNFKLPQRKSSRVFQTFWAKIS